MRYHFKPLGWVLSKKKKKEQKQETSIGDNVEKSERLCIAGGNVKQGSHCGKQSGGSSKDKNRISVRSSSFTSGSIPNRMESRDSEIPAH